jgi:SNF2-related domain
MENRYRPGTIVHARGREWIVLPPREPEVLRLRPLTTAQGDEVGLFLPLEGERVRTARFADPQPVSGGDATGIMTLFDAARLSLRSGAGPFRSLGHISVVPRPYQFVPLIMALRQSPVRLLIADDVGVGKTIEAAMIARELLDRSLARRLGVLCPAHLCDQWERALREKFAIETVLVQPSQIRRLERNLPPGDVSIYEYYSNFVASIDFVKSKSQRDQFLAHAPDLVIVDEAHASARPRGSASGAEHQRYELLRDLARDPNRQILLVTATPHSGIEESFRSLLGLLDTEFDRDPAQPLDQDGLVPYLVQRRRPFGERRPRDRRGGATSRQCRHGGKGRANWLGARISCRHAEMVRADRRRPRRGAGGGSRAVAQTDESPTPQGAATRAAHRYLGHSRLGAGASSQGTLRWRRQSRANPSLKPNSLLAGKIQGILFV